MVDTNYLLSGMILQVGPHTIPGHHSHKNPYRSGSNGMGPAYHQGVSLESPLMVVLKVEILEGLRVVGGLAHLKGSKTFI